MKYKLVNGRYLNGYGQFLSDPEDRVQGVLLLQVLGSRKLKVQILPGKTTNDVQGFSEAAETYER